jgi:hypothetical protein
MHHSSTLHEIARQQHAEAVRRARRPVEQPEEEATTPSEIVSLRTRLAAGLARATGSRRGLGETPAA